MMAVHALLQKNDATLIATALFAIGCTAVFAVSLYIRLIRKSLSPHCKFHAKTTSMQSAPTLFQVGLLGLTLVFPSQPATGSRDPRTSQPLATSERAPNTNIMPIVEFNGCTAIRDTSEGRVCMMTPDSRLTLWVAGKCQDLQLSEDGQSVAVETDVIQNGCQVRISRSSKQTSALLILFHGQLRMPIWRIGIDRSKSTFLDFVQRVRERAAIDSDIILANLEQMERRKLDLDAQIELSYAKALFLVGQADKQRAMLEWRRMENLALAAGFSQLAARAKYLQADLLKSSGRYDEARDLASEILRVAPFDDASTRIRAEFITGLIERDLDHTSSALFHMTNALDFAERSDDTDFQRRTLPLVGEALCEMDRCQEAAAILKKAELMHADAPDCALADYWQQLAFLGYNIAESRFPAASVVENKEKLVSLAGIFNNAIKFRKMCGSFDNERLSANLYSAMAAWQNLAGNPDSALRWIHSARSIKAISTMTSLQLREISALSLLKTKRLRDAISELDRLEQDISALNPEIRENVMCKITMSRLEISRQKLVNDKVHRVFLRKCVTSENLSMSERRSLIQRAAKLGIAVEETKLKT